MKEMTIEEIFGYLGSNFTAIEELSELVVKKIMSEENLTPEYIFDKVKHMDSINKFIRFDMNREILWNRAVRKRSQDALRYKNES